MSRQQRRFICLCGLLDVEDISSGAQWLVGGVLEKGIDDVELVTDVGGPHRPLRCRRGWLALMPSGWTGGVDLRFLKNGQVVEQQRVDDLDEFIDAGDWTTYAPLDTG